MPTIEALAEAMERDDKARGMSIATVNCVEEKELCNHSGVKASRNFTCLFCQEHGKHIFIRGCFCTFHNLEVSSTAGPAPTEWMLNGVPGSC